jgi:hypothetical protein
MSDPAELPEVAHLLECWLVGRPLTDDRDGSTRETCAREIGTIAWHGPPDRIAVALSVGFTTIDGGSACSCPD